VDRAAQSGAQHHHGLGRGRRQHPRRHRHGHRLHTGRRADRGHRLVTHLHRHLALLAAGRAGNADPADRARRPDAAAPAGGAAMSMATDTARARAAELLRGLLFRHEGILLAVLTVALIVLALQSEQFLTVDNLLNQGRLMAEIGLVALPMTFIIITGGIDLSVGSIMGLCVIVVGYSWKNLGLPLEAAIPATLAVGTAAGFVNGWFITRV